MINYCQKCGAITKQLRPYLFDCTECHFKNFENPRPTTGILLINSKNEFLLCERAKEPAKGFYDLPGGFIEPAETAEQSAVREIQEELGISVTELTYFGSYHDQYMYHGFKYYVLSYSFVAQYDEKQNITAADDVANVVWTPFDCIPYNQLSGDSVRDFIDEYARSQP